MDKRTDTAVVAARDVHFRYGGEPVLHGANFIVRQGDFVAVVGANGAGKSTLLRILLGELPALKGSISLFGTEIRHFHDWQRVGYVPQNGAALVGQFPATALEVVAANLYSGPGSLFRGGGRDRARALAALEQVGMAGCAKQMIGQLSGGQLQRVLIARVLVRGCGLLFLDEPATGVDAQSVDSLYRLLAELNQGGMTVVMVTHDMARAAAYVGRALCLEEGSVVELDREQMEHELHHRHKHPPAGE